MMEYLSRSKSGSEMLLPTQQLVELWQMPLHLWFSWWEMCFSIPPAHRLTPKEAEDKRHAQLVVPEPLKSSDDRELFA